MPELNWDLLEEEKVNWEEITDIPTEKKEIKTKPNLLKSSVTPISKLITGKSIGERADLLNKRQDVLSKEGSEKIARGEKPPSTAEFFFRSLPQATGQALINFLDLTPLDIGLMGATMGVIKVPIKGTTIGQVAKTTPIFKKGFVHNVEELGRYEQTLKTITPLSSRGVTSIINPDIGLGVIPKAPVISQGEFQSKINLTKYKPEIQEGIKKIINSNPELLARKQISHAELEVMSQQLESTPIVEKMFSLPEGQYAAESLKVYRGEDALIRSTLKESYFDSLVPKIKDILIKRQTQGVGRIGTETARSLEARKIMIRPQSEIAELINQKILSAQKDSLLKEKDLKVVVSSLTDLRKTVLSKDFNPSWFDKGYEFWLNNILSGPWTHTVNLTSNALFGGLKPVEKTVYSAVDTVLSFFTKKREHYFSESPAQAKGLGMALTGKKLPVEIAKSGASKFTDYPGAIKGFKGKMIRLPTQALVVEDNLQKRMIGFGELVGRAEAIAKQEGLSGSTLIARKNQLIANPTEKLISEVQKEQLYRTFQDSTGLGEILKGVRGIQGSRWIQPFINTLSSIVTKAFERTPAGFIKVGVRGIKQLKGTPYPQKEVAIDIGNASIGTALFATVAYALKKGTITGAPPRDKAKRDIFYRQGKQPYSILYKGKYIPSSRLEPYGTSLMQMTDFLQGYYESDKEVPVDKLSDAVFKISYSLSNKTFLSGITNFVSALSDPERYADTFMGRIAGGFIPYSGALRNINQMTDLTVREPQGIVEKVKSQIPGLAKNVPQKISSFGEKIQRKPIGFSRFIPFPITKEEYDTVASELSRLDISISYPSKNISLPWRKEKVKLTRDEYAEYLTRSGGVITRILQNLISSDNYQRIQNNTIKQKMIENAMSKAREATRNELILKKTQSSLNTKLNWKTIE